MATDPDLQPRYGTVDRDYARQLATTPPAEDGPVWMVNLMHYRERADYADGRAAEISGQEADDLYAPFASLAAVGAEVVFVANVDMQLIGDPQWDRVAVVKYPTRRSFMEMQQRDDFVAAHAHKDAGMAATIVIGAVPRPNPVLPDDAPDWADVPHPPTEEDPSVVVLHVLRYHEAQRPEMDSYAVHAGQVAMPHGVRIDGWFEAEGTIVGDGRSWDEVRFNAFPSKAAFMAVVLDPDRLAAQQEYRQVAIADTYSMVLRPVINRLAESLADTSTT